MQQFIDNNILHLVFLQTENYAGGKKNSLVLFYETTAPVTQAILDYMYSGRLDIDMKHVNLLLRNLDYLEMEDAKKECERALITNINFGNCFGILVLASTYPCYMHVCYRYRCTKGNPHYK